MRTRLMFIISLFLISFCIVGYKFADDNDDEKIEITKIETEIEIGSELIIAVKNGKDINIVSENENIAWAYVNGNEVTIIGVSEGETIVTISVDDNIEDEISIIVTVNDPFGSGSSNVGNTTDNKDDNADTFCPLESNKEPEEIPDGFRLVYIRMSGKEVPAWTDDFY